MTLPGLNSTPYVLTDLQDIWKAVNLGNVKAIYVEQGFAIPENLSKSIFTLKINGEVRLYEKDVKNIMDEIIVQVALAGGEVHEVKQGELSDGKKMVLVPKCRNLKYEVNKDNRLFKKKKFQPALLDEDSVEQEVFEEIDSTFII